MDIFYYHVFGNVEYLNQCMLSLITLRYIGLCNYDVIIFTDNVERVQETLKRLKLTDNVYVKHVTHSRPLFGRYVCAMRLIESREYRYITYLDNDIVINKPLNDFNRFPYGSQFFIHEEKNVPQGLSGYFDYTPNIFGNNPVLTANSGLFTFISNDHNYEVFKQILDKEKHYPSLHYNRYGDQPLFATTLNQHHPDTEHLELHEKLINTPSKYKDKQIKTFTHYNVGHTVKGKFPELLKLTSNIPKSLECSNKITSLMGMRYEINSK